MSMEQTDLPRSLRDEELCIQQSFAAPAKSLNRAIPTIGDDL